MEKCPACEAVFAENEFFCADCGEKLVTAPDPIAKKSKKSKVRFIIKLTILVIMMVAVSRLYIL